MKIYLSLLAIFCCLTISLQYKVIDKPSLGIVNGTTADNGEFPYQVELRDLVGAFQCGGGILDSEWILTAGQCIRNAPIATVVYGTNRLYDSGDWFPNTTSIVKGWFVHPNYTEILEGIPLYDVGLLQLLEPIPLGDKAQPIKLAEPGQEVPFHVQGVLAGWGFNETFGRPTPYLQKINLQLLSDQECTNKINNHSGEDSFRSVHHLCTDDYYNGECFGDGGNPFVVNGTTFGVGSWTYKPCGIVPGAYSRLSNPEYRNWIKSVTNI